MLEHLRPATWAAAAQAQTYPYKPIRMIVSIAAGSVTDVIMRAAAIELQPRLGQPLVIENMGGASGIIAARACAQAAADGYTICIINHSQLSYNPLMFDRLPYDADTDLVPVARLFFLIEGVFVNPGAQREVGRRAEGAGAEPSPTRSTTPRWATARSPTCSGSG